MWWGNALASLVLVPHLFMTRARTDRARPPPPTGEYRCREAPSASHHAPESGPERRRPGPPPPPSPCCRRSSYPPRPFFTSQEVFVPLRSSLPEPIKILSQNLHWLRPVLARYPISPFFKEQTPYKNTLFLVCYFANFLTNYLNKMISKHPRIWPNNQTTQD